MYPIKLRDGEILATSASVVTEEFIDDYTLSGVSSISAQIDSNVIISVDFDCKVDDNGDILENEVLDVKENFIFEDYGWSTPQTEKELVTALIEMALTEASDFIEFEVMVGPGDEAEFLLGSATIIDGAEKLYRTTVDGVNVVFQFTNYLHLAELFYSLVKEGKLLN